MSDATWDEVDDYFADVLALEDDALRAAVAASAAAGLPDIQVTPNQGKLLQLLAGAIGARRILEVGTLGGYSTIWLARALPPGGRLLSLEVSDEHARVARANLAAAGLAEVAEVRVGDARDTLRALVEGGTEPFDLVFIDADKPGNPTYFEAAVALSHPGTLIVVDNVVRAGAVADAASDDAAVRGVRALFDLAASTPGVTGTAIQTVGAKGYDGFALFRVV
ncbi:MAG: O-methyltransferase [Acidobacteriota bacterium]|nr:O-methyltransferase [Acidobacteriota bacterium]